MQHLRWRRFIDRHSTIILATLAVIIAAGVVGRLIATSSIRGFLLAAGGATCIGLGVMLLRHPETGVLLLLSGLFLGELTILGNFTLYKVLGIVVAGAWFVNLVVERRKLPKFPGEAIFPLFLGLLSLASGLWALDPTRITSPVQSYILNSIFIFIIADQLRTIAQFRQAALWIVSISVFWSILAILQVADLYGAPALLIAEQGRATGWLSDSNFFAMYQVIALALAIWLWFRSRNISLITRAAWLVSSGLILVSIATTSSRSGIVAAALVLGLSFVLESDRSRWPLIIFVVIVLTIFSPLYIDRLAGRFETLQLKGLEDRGTYLWPLAARLFRRRPILGIGASNFGSYALLSFGANRVVHNSYLSVLVELGIAGFVLFIGAQLLILMRIYIIRSSADPRPSKMPEARHLANALLSALAALILLNLFFTAETSKPIWIIAALSSATWRIFRNSPQHSQSRQSK